MPKAKSKKSPVVIHSEDIVPAPGPHEDADWPKEKPGETLLAKVLLRAQSVGVLIAALLLAWIIGALGMSVVWVVLLVIAIYKTDAKLKKLGWISYYRSQERKRLHEEVA